MAVCKEARWANLVLTSALSLGCSGSGDASPTLVAAFDVADDGECRFGGTIVGAGRDSNGDGVLQESEIQSRAVLCRDSLGANSTEVRGSVVIVDESDIERLAGVERITGNLTIEAAGLDEFGAGPVLSMALADLEEIDGLVVVSAFSDAQNLSFPSLRRVGGIRVERPIRPSSLLFSLDFPVLEEAEELRIEGGPELSSIAFPELSVANDVEIVGGGVSEIRFPKLERARNIRIAETGARVVDFALLEQVTGVWSLGDVFSSDAFAITLPSLRTVGGFFVRDSPAVTAINLPLLQEVSGFGANGGVFSVTDCPEASILSVPVLVTVDRRFVVENTGIPQCRLDAIASTLTAESVSTAGNDELALCN